jgi:hypothetical protein
MFIKHALTLLLLLFLLFFPFLRMRQVEGRRCWRQASGLLAVSNGALLFRSVSKETLAGAQEVLFDVQVGERDAEFEEGKEEGEVMMLIDEEGKRSITH